MSGDLARALLNARTRKMHTRQQAAATCGAAPTTYLRWEERGCKPQVRHRLGISKYLGVSVEEVNDLIEGATT